MSIEEMNHEEEAATEDLRLAMKGYPRALDWILITWMNLKIQFLRTQ